MVSWSRQQGPAFRTNVEDSPLHQVGNPQRRQQGKQEAGEQWREDVSWRVLSADVDAIMAKEGAKGTPEQQMRSGFTETRPCSTYQLSQRAFQVAGGLISLRADGIVGE